MFTRRERLSRSPPLFLRPRPPLWPLVVVNPPTVCLVWSQAFSRAGRLTCGACWPSSSADTCCLRYVSTMEGLRHRIYASLAVADPKPGLLVPCRAAPLFERARRFVDSKATKQWSKGVGVRAFYRLGCGIIVSRQEVPGKVTCGAGRRKMELPGRHSHA